MLPLSRRAFLGTTLAGLTTSRLFADEKPKKASPKAAAVKESDDPPFQPSTLFLTWQRDPTTTMTVQWIGVRGETADTNVSYSVLKAGHWQTQATSAKPYPMTDFK